MKTHRRLALIFGLSVLFGAMAFAQMPPLTVDPVGTRLQAVTIVGYQTQAEVAGAPYSAIEESIYSRRQEDGTYENRSATTTRIYRDSQGRTRAERYETSYTSGSSEPQLRSIYIADPVSGALYRLNPENHTATRDTWDANARALAQLAGADNVAPPPADLQSHATTTSLGSSTMQGLAVEGTRQTLSAPAGVYDNHNPINIALETWVSPELKVAIFSQRDNYTGGNRRTTRLTEINRAEPDPALFHLPSNYKISDPPIRGGRFAAP